MKKVLYVMTFIIVMLVSFLGITYSYEYNDNDSLSFNLIGPSTLYVDVNTDYVEYGISVMNNGVDVSSMVTIDSSLVNMNELGEYKVKYELDVDGNKEYVYRDVIVIDKFSPLIKLKGDSIVYVILDGSYYEEGYVVSDNYDTDLSDKVVIKGNVNTSKIGEYELEYSVVDSSNNKSSVKRKVVVKNPEITLADATFNRYTLSSYDVTKYSNTVVDNKWLDFGISYEVYIRDSFGSYNIMLKNKDNSLEYLYDMMFVKNNYYESNIDLTKLPNGNYSIYIVGNKEEKLISKMDPLAKLYRAKVDDKLILISYEKDLVNISVNDFKYEYDVLIDPGHGGSDIGASNGLVNEKTLNLRQSLYEKCRYESMGLKVYMTRYDDSYGTLMGTYKLDQLQRRAFTVGYYGVVSKIIYSNHHNASENKYEHGFEILVSNNAVLSDLVLEKSIYNRYRKYYNLYDNMIRLYSKDYVSGDIYDKLSAKSYSYTDYYAVIRIPNELFNVKTSIYEPIYISNSNDFSWYYTSGKWIDVTEIKIEEVVNYLGFKYNSDNSMCI